MKIFIESIDQGIWDAIVNSPFIPKHVKKFTCRKTVEHVD